MIPKLDLTGVDLSGKDYYRSEADVLTIDGDSQDPSKPQDPPTSPLYTHDNIPTPLPTRRKELLHRVLHSPIEVNYDIDINDKFK